MGTPEATLSVRITQIDHILRPSGYFDKVPFPQVPVIRIYGVSSVGHKACVHIHQVYPYFFVEYNGLMTPESVNEYIGKLIVSLNHAIALSLKRDLDSQFVRAILLVKGIHFYGFHSMHSPFLKILVLDPSLYSRAVNLMRSGVVMHTRFRIYESHLNFILQFMCDFGLYGCGWIHLGQIFFRGEDDDQVDIDAVFGEKASAILSSPYHRQSRLPIELDAVAPQILNRHLLVARNILSQQESLPASPVPTAPVVLGVRELWDDERRRRVNNGLHPTPALPVDPSDNSRGLGRDWTMEAAWWEELMKNITAERASAKEPTIAEHEWEQWVMSTFESVQALWQSEVHRPMQHENGRHNDMNPFVLTQTPDYGASNPAKHTAEVDESLLAEQEMLQDDDEYIPEEDQEEGLDERFEGEGIPEDEIDISESEYPRQLSLSEEASDSDDEIEALLQPNDSDEAEAAAFRGAWLEIYDRKRARSSSEFETPSKRPRYNSLSPSASRDERSDDSSSDFHDQLETSYRRALFDVKTDVATQLLTKNATEVQTETQEQQQDSESNRPTLKADTTLPTKRLRATYCFQKPWAMLRTKTCSYRYIVPPPSISELLETLESVGLPMKLYQAPHFSRHEDTLDGPKEYAGVIYNIPCTAGIDSLDDWQGEKEEDPANQSWLTPHRAWGFEHSSFAPTVRAIRLWLQHNPRHQTRILEVNTSVGEGNLYNAPKADQVRGGNDMSILTFEIFALSVDDKFPNSTSDEIVAAFFTFLDHSTQATPRQGIILVRNERLNPSGLRDFEIEIVMHELDLINAIIDAVVDLDPDIIAGWEVQTSSWGYLCSRGNNYGLDVGEHISRAPGRFNQRNDDRWGIRTTTSLKIVGRHVFNVWRLMRAEHSLNMYTFENVSLHALEKRVPKYTPKVLTTWYLSEDLSLFTTVLRYFAERTCMTLQLLAQADVITKTSEFARVFGVDFFSVISRGSQFKVESFMFRIAKPESFVLLSPSKQDVGRQNAAECMPLIMEPLSAFYNGPLAVLDFQSLYPSIMIAYNYCYSTCLGRVSGFQGKNKLGVSELNISPSLLNRLKDHLEVSPNGIVYVKPTIRKGLLGRMLTELLDTRVMVKQAMKTAQGNKALRKILDARQLSLKYIANVTYGYTSATFSGRMPAVEIADSIVQSGRETLEKAIQLIETNKRWGARVVYGDTDSVFVYLEGKTKDQAFKIGNEIAQTVTLINPAPVKLKFEKVFLPCILMAKKRYVGFKYEAPDEVTPQFDAKGIETVRRDGTPAQQRMVEKCLKILFRTQDLSKVKDYCYETWAKILRNKLPVQDFIFAKEVKMGTYSDIFPPPPGAAVAARRMTEDAGYEPQYGERVPYVIVRGDRSSRLVDRAVAPEQLIVDSQISLDAFYYIARVLIPPLERIFNLVGADVREWYDDMPKDSKLDSMDLSMSPTKAKLDILARLKIEEHFWPSECLSCGTPFAEGICPGCMDDPASSLPTLLHYFQAEERHLLATQSVCSTCAGRPPADPVPCLNLSCSWLYERNKAEKSIELLEGLRDMMDDIMIVNTTRGCSEETLVSVSDIDSFDT